MPIQNILSGPDAFYLRPNYFDETKKAAFSSKPPPHVYEKKFCHPVARIAKLVAAIIILPIGLYNAIHCLLALPIIPAAIRLCFKRKDLNINRRCLIYPWAGDKDRKYLRTSIKVDGVSIDVLISGTPSTLNNKRWTLYVGGNAQPYEHAVDQSIDLLRNLNSNGIYFNYPGVGSSSGVLSQDGAVKAYRAVLSFLEDNKDGIGAKEIILYGWSMGGAIQGEALKKHSPLPNVHYVAVKDRTLADLPKLITLLTNRIFAFLARFFGWNMKPAAKAKESSIPEIILQASQKKLYEEIHSEKEIVDDGVIPKDASYAKEILKNIEQSKAPKIVLAAPCSHCLPLTVTKPLADRILTHLRSTQAA